MDKPQEAWKPEPAKHLDAWKKIWYDIVDGRRFQIAQTHGHKAAEQYRYHTAERDYFYTWGKLPHHVIADNCQVCDAEQAREVASWVDAHHRRYFHEMDEFAKEHIAKWREAQDRRMKRASNMPEYKAAKDERQRVIQYAKDMITKVRAEMSDIRTHGKTQGQQGDTATEQRAEEANRKEADTHTAKE